MTRLSTDPNAAAGDVEPSRAYVVVWPIPEHEDYPEMMVSIGSTPLGWIDSETDVRKEAKRAYLATMEVWTSDSELAAEYGMEDVPMLTSSDDFAFRLTDEAEFRSWRKAGVIAVEWDVL